MVLRFMVLVLSLGFVANVHAAGKKSQAPSNEDWSKWSVPAFTDLDQAALNKEWPSANSSKRKLANAQEFAENNLKSDVVEFRKAYLAVTTPEQLEALLKKAEEEWSTYSSDLKYFTANLLVVRSLRGVIWRMRPLFESGNLFSGNRATHGATVNLLRKIATGIDTFFPTEQWAAGFAYLTEPSAQMTTAQQFKTVREFQKFLIVKFIPALQVAARRTNTLLETEQVPTLVWDRQIVYGTATFADGAKRYIGFGPAEVYFSTSLLYRGIHDALVFAAYNQDDLLNIMGRIGRRFGVDSALQSAEMGMTAAQRNEIISASVKKSGFLTLQNYNGSTFGTAAMSSAYEALKTSAKYQKKAYDYLKDGKSTDSFVFNPIHFQSESSPRLERAMNNMIAAVSGVADIRDPVSGDVVKLNLPEFYKKPYPSLAVLMANGFDLKSQAEKELTNIKGEKLVYRNYLHGQATSWDNQSWSKIVPSAQSQKADYMQKAKRVIFYSLGTPLVAGQVGLFAR